MSDETPNKLTRSRGTGKVVFGSDIEQQQQEAVQDRMEQDTRRALVTPGEWQDKVEKAILELAKKANLYSEIDEILR